MRKPLRYAAAHGVCWGEARRGCCLLPQGDGQLMGGKCCSCVVWLCYSLNKMPLQQPWKIQVTSYWKFKTGLGKMGKAGITCAETRRAKQFLEVQQVFRFLCCSIFLLWVLARRDSVMKITWIALCERRCSLRLGSWRRVQWGSVCWENFPSAGTSKHMHRYVRTGVFGVSSCMMGDGKQSLMIAPSWAMTGLSPYSTSAPAGRRTSVQDGSWTESQRARTWCFKHC